MLFLLCRKQRMFSLSVEVMPENEQVAKLLLIEYVLVLSIF